MQIISFCEHEIKRSSPVSFTEVLWLHTHICFNHLGDVKCLWRKTTRTDITLLPRNMRVKMWSQFLSHIGKILENASLYTLNKLLPLQSTTYINKTGAVGNASERIYSVRTWNPACCKSKKPILVILKCFRDTLETVLKSLYMLKRLKELHAA